MHRKPVIYGVAVSVVLLGLIQGFTYQQRHIQKENEHQALLRELNNAKTRFLDLLYNDVATANSLAIIAQEYDVNENFSNVAQQILSKSKYATAIQLTWNGVIKNVFPLKGYESTIGIDTHRDSLRLSEEKKVLEKGDVFFAGPRRLRQGGIGILGKVPILVDGKLRGIVVILTNIETVKKTLDPKGANSEFVYRLKKNAGPDTTVYSLSQNKTAKHTEVISTSIPEGDWTLSISYSEYHHPVTLPVWVIALRSLFAILGGYLTYRTARHPYLLKKIIEQKTRTLSESEQKFRDLVEKNLAGVYILDQGKIIYANPRLSEILGYSDDELLAMGPFDFICQEDRELFVNVFKRQNAGHPGPFHFKVRAAAKDKSILWLEFFLNATIYDNQKASIATVLEVTNRELAEAELLKSQANMRSILDNTDVGFLLLDKDYRMVATNKRFDEGYATAIGTKFKKNISYLDEVQEHGRIPAERFFEAVKRDRKPVQWETKVDNLNGIFYFDISLMPVISNDNLIGFSMSATDITSKKNMEIEREQIAADLVRHNKDLEQFAYIVSHNLRAPLANILGLSTLLQDDAISDEDHLELSNALFTSVSRLDEVVSDLNAILQVRREVSELKQTVEFSVLVSSIIDSIRQLIEQNDVTIQYNFDEVQHFYGIKSYIHSIFYNLISNGIKYRKQGEPCRIFIESKKENGKLLLLFKDNGTGIDLKKQGDKIFGLYKRFHPNIEGKGIGLYMVKNQVETLGGKISLTSEPGVGTEFKLQFEA